MIGLRRLAALPLALAGNWCAANVRREPPATSRVGAKPCMAADSTTGPRAMTRQLDGEYRLTMVATSGARSGSATTGSLTFRGRAGSASIPLDSVGAVAAGDIGSRDPNRPGVLLVSSSRDSSDGKPMLRFGANANRSDIRAFDSAYLILMVDVADPAGFAGRWRSGVDASHSGGYYCADRVASSEL